MGAHSKSVLRNMKIEDGVIRIGEDEIDCWLFFYLHTKLYQRRTQKLEFGFGWNFMEVMVTKSRSTISLKLRGFEHGL